MKGRVTVNDYGQILSGHTYCFRDQQAAEQESRRSTTNPGVKTLEWQGLDVCLAVGDDYITPGGRRGTHYYGRRGRHITLVTR